MRFALSVASVLVLTSAAFAEEAKPAEAPPPAAAPAPVAPTKKLALRVVRVLPETSQALLFDKTKGTHVLVDVGTQVDGFKVADIDEDTVTLSPIEGGNQIVLAGPDPSWRRHRDAKPVAAKPVAAPEDPYASAAPVDPYADDVRVAEAPTPIAAGENGVRTVEAPDASAPPPRVASAAGIAPTAAPVVTVAAPVAEPVAAPSAEPSDPVWSPPVEKPEKPAPATTDGFTVIARADVTTALANFGALANAVKGSFTADGARLDTVAADSLFAKAGLRAGDTITEINHQPMHSIDDAATLYSRASVLKTITIQLVRAGKPMTLQLTIR